MQLFSRWQWFLVAVLAGALGTSCGKAQVSSSTPEPAGGSGGPAGGRGGPAGGGGGSAGGAAPGTTGGGPGFVLPDSGANAGANPDAAGAQTTCVNLQCQQRACPGGTTTSVSGTVYAPNGTLPLYNVAVYVPNAPLDPLVRGSSCERCGTLASGKPIASALSDHEGKFKVGNVPAGKDIPLVFQVGKWRRKVIIPQVLPCQENALADPQVTRLPRNRGEGDLPRVAITQGSCDDLICLLPKLGIDLAETGVAGQDRPFTYYDGSRLDLPGVTAAVGLWRSFEELQKYDMVINSCRCSEEQEAKGPAAFAAVTRYLDAGGRMFNTHFSYDFLKFSPDPLLSAAVVTGMDRTMIGGPAVIDTSFPKGKALADWIKFLDPSVVFGQIPLRSIFGNLTGANAQVWARDPAKRPAFVTINTPVSARPDEQCGRVVDLDTHVTVGDMQPMMQVFRRSLAECDKTLNKAEHVLAFMLFDLAACIQEDTKPPAPPPVID
jgi:hypothetical protein